MKIFATIRDTYKALFQNKQIIQRRKLLEDFLQSTSSPMTAGDAKRAIGNSVVELLSPRSQSRKSNGLLISDDLLLTNYHCVVQSRIVRHRGHIYPIKVLAQDPRHDIALCALQGYKGIPRFFQFPVSKVSIIETIPLNMLVRIDGRLLMRGGFTEGSVARVLRTDDGEIFHDLLHVNMKARAGNSGGSVVHSISGALIGFVSITDYKSSAHIVQFKHARALIEDYIASM